MRKLIALTPAQIKFVRMAVSHVAEFGEDLEQSVQARAAEVRVVRGINRAITHEIPVARLLTAAKNAERFLRWFENEWNELTDQQHGAYPGIVAMRGLQNAIAGYDAAVVQTG